MIRVRDCELAHMVGPQHNHTGISVSESATKLRVLGITRDGIQANVGALGGVIELNAALD